MSTKPRLFADLHCHPSLYGFNRMRNSADEGDPDLFHPWHVLPSDGKKMAAGAHAGAYSQCNFAQLTRGRVRLTFASLTPIEKGFLQEGSQEERRPFVWEMLRLATGATLVGSGRKLAQGDRKGAAREAGRILRNHGPLRSLLNRLYVGYSAQRIAHMLSDEYDYWDELVREYEFLQLADSHANTATCEYLEDGEMVSREVRGTYHLVRDANQLEEIIEDGDEDLAVVMTIEGGHVLTMGADQRPLPEEVVFDRLRALKQWPHPVFILTLAHHFDNGVCGHAHTIPDKGAAVIDQSPRLGEGLEPRDDLGIRVVREVLDLDEDLADRGGRRMVLDVKHLSPRSRLEFYDRIVRPYNERHREQKTPNRPPIPVVGTHMGYAGVATLRELIDCADREDDHRLAGPYYAWGMNLSDEDVRMVHESEGLIGIIFDQRVLGAAPGLKIPTEMWPDLLWRQITGMVDVIMTDDRLDADDRVRIWDRLCIGTDFDGFMHPVPCYPTVLEFQDLADDLAERLHRHRHTRMIARIGVDSLVEKFAWRNAYDFARVHLPAAAGQI